MKHALLRFILLRTNKLSKVCCLFLVVLLAFTFWITFNLRNTPYVNHLLGQEIDFSKADNVTGFSFNIVPNIIHIIHIVNENDASEISFVEMIVLKAAHRNQKPDRIIIHCNCEKLRGKYWNMVKDLEGLELKRISLPTRIFGKRLSSAFHASDIARIRLMMKYGGIYIDTDTYIVKSLDKYRQFEFTIGWPIGQNLGTQILVGHKNARFLKLWYNSYKYYRPERWYYNAGELPTSSILMVRPGLVHRVPRNFGVHNLAETLYARLSSEWKTYDAIHLLYRHRSYLVPTDKTEDFNENNIKLYDRTFGEMARLVLYGTTNIIDNYANYTINTEVQKSNFTKVPNLV